MKTLRSIALALVGLALILSKPALSQSNNPQAVDWFEIGLKESNLTKKISAYTKAVEADPNFFEALYNLGLAYKQKQDFANAEKYLLQASNAWPSEIQNEAKTRVYYELATSYKKLGKLTRAEATLAQAKNLAPNNNLKGALAAELGRLWYEQERYDEALTELRASVQLNPENQAKIGGLISAIESSMALQQLYNRAVSAKQSGNLNEAKTLFEQIRAINAGYKDVQAQLVQLEARPLAQANKAEPAKVETPASEANKELTLLYDEARRAETEGKFELAVTAYEKLLAQAETFRDARARLQEAKQKLEEARVQTQLEEQYAAGLAALKTRDWTRAIVNFERILNTQRDYRDARRRLLEAQKGLERESNDTIIARYYADGIAALKKDDLGSALAAFEKVKSLNPNYRDVASRWREVETLLQQQTQAPPTAPATASTLVDSLYREGLEAVGKEDWMRAVVALEKLQLLHPDYREVPDMLTQARAHFAKSETAVLEAKSEPAGGSEAPIYVGGSLLALLAAAIGFVALSPVTRARLQLLRGNETAAMQIYERELLRHPNHVKLYSPLANIYLRLGRRDERALKIYKTILQLNIAVTNREEINTIVAQNFLNEGRTDSDAIEVLEKQLAVEMNRKKLTHS